jgi:putative acetyltransferase
MTIIRRAEPQDAAAIRTVHEQAFAISAEVNLVDRLSERGKVVLSLVAEQNREVVGHILFSPVVIEAEGKTCQALGLAPLAVLPAVQRQGIGSLLTRTALEQCRAAGHERVVVLGDPAYSSRFGSLSAGRHGLSCQFEVPAEAFMALELRDGALQGCAGTAWYQPEFSEL